MNDAATVVRIAGVSKRFDDVTAVDNVSLDIARGEFFSLLGPSGCGKTTLLRMIGGFEEPTSGEIRIDGISMAGVPAYRRPTNMVFQSYAIFPHLDVAGNVGYGLRNEPADADEIRRRVTDALAMVKLAGFERRRAHELSGGQRQRVALARALIKRPAVLLLDEPLAALDKKLREDMQIELRTLQRNVGITFLMVTHDQEEALTLSDRVAVMDGGRVVQVASPRELYDHPLSFAVAGFIGRMNFLPGEVIGIHDGRARVRTLVLGDLDIAARTDTATGTRVTVAIRPERLGLARTPPAPPLRGIAGRLLAATYLGDRSHYYVRVAGHDTPLAVALQNAGDMRDDPPAGDQPVWVTWPDAGAVLLPAR